MTVQTFMSGPQARARYWARSFAGYAPFAATRPNAAHAALAGLQARGWVGGGLITQNVDRLHHRAGSRGVIELHGTTHMVRCLSCGHRQDRAAFQDTLAALNPAAADAAARMNAAAAAAKARRAAAPTPPTTAACGAALEAATPEDDAARNRMIQDHIREDGPLAIPIRRPDGDTELVDAGVGFAVPPCGVCGTGTLMPDVVFFGDSLDKGVAAAAAAAAAACDAMLVVGSSLTVYSAFRLARAAREAGAGLAIVNVGPTRADEVADLKIEARAGEALPALAASGPLTLPRF
jgi:NAD-dependent deacetylase sirtuin 4